MWPATPAGPLYEQLLVVLAGKLRSGEWPVGTKLPTEAELVVEYAVSRTTARRALDELRRRGLVVRRAGRGTFVADPRLQADQAFLTSFTDEIERLGYRPGVEVLADERTTADPGAAGHLEITPGSQVRRLRRLRTADEQPIFVCDSVLSLARFPALDELDAHADSLYRAIERTVGRPVSSARQWTQAAAADTRVADELGVAAGTPVLLVERLTCVSPAEPLVPDVPVELVRAFFHPDRYRGYTELTPRPAVSSLTGDHRAVAAHVPDALAPSARPTRSS